MLVLILSFMVMNLKKTHPVNDELIEWLWSHPEVRKDIWNKIHTNSND